jgi:hypothetical protein
MTSYRPENRNLFSDTYLNIQATSDFVQIESESRAAFAALKRVRHESRPERFGDGREQQLREEYLDRVLDVLGWSRSSEGRIPGGGKPDYTLFDNPIEKDAALSHVGTLEFFQDALCLCEAKSWALNLHRAGSDRRSARGQIYGYLEDTHLPWGIATNGAEWLLVWRGYSRAQQRDYSVSLDDLLGSESWSPQFNFFFGFFSRIAFERGLPLQAIEKSRLSGIAVGQDLKANVYEALLELGRSIYRTRSSEFRTPEELGELKAECLILLYRLLFVNYAESRRLLPMEDSDLYRRSFSLLRVKESIQRLAPRMLETEYTAISDDSSDFLRNIRKLFEAIDTGLPKAQVPPYNGGLFRRGTHRLLDRLEISDRTVARVVDLLSRTRDDPGRFVDYSYLGVRELGSIYEGLLEFNFVAVDTVSNGLASSKARDGPAARCEPEPTNTDTAEPDAPLGHELELVTGKGERKASGSFYTPDSVVQYIVRETLGPLVAARLDDAARKGEDRQLAVLNIRVLDPAMGSGHFLVAATEFLAEKLLEAGEQGSGELASEIDASDLEGWAKRQVASHCIYGVDLNPMAVELSKVSLWLSTFSRGQPLTFLDHRLKTGNSLLGARLNELSVFPTFQRPSILASHAASGSVRPFDISGLVDEFRAPIERIDEVDEVSVADVERKKELYLEFLSSPRYGRVLALANAQSAIRYVPPSNPDAVAKAWDRIVRAAVDPSGLEWDRTTQDSVVVDGAEFARRRLPFHWDLEFPEVFGRAMPGFDAVIGNPPYVRIYRGQITADDVAFFQRRFSAAHMKFDLYALFLELGIGLLRKSGRLGFIVPDKFTSAPYGEPLRRKILSNRLVKILDLRRERVFPGVAVAPVIVIVEAGSPGANETTIMAPSHGVEDLTALREIATVNQITFDRFPQAQIRIDASFGGLSLLDTLSHKSLPLSDAYYVNWGLRTGTKERTLRLISNTPRGNNPKALLRGEDIRERYILERPPRFIDYDITQLYNPMFPELFESAKVVFRKISGPEGLRAVLDESGAFCFSTLICAVNLVAIRRVTRVGVRKPTRAAKRFRDPSFVLAIANSRLVAWWYSQSYSDKLGVNPGHVQALPLPASLLDVTPAKAPPDLAELLSSPLESLTPDLLEVVVTQGGARLQELGDSMYRSALSFREWISRELGSRAAAPYGNKLVQIIETTDEDELIHTLEDLHRSESLRLDPRRRETQDLVLTEYRNVRNRLRQIREDMATLDNTVEKCIHLIFGLTHAESAQIALGAQGANPSSTPIL